MTYLSLAVMTHLGISIAWSARDILSYQIENGIGFDIYNPKLGVYLAVHILALMSVGVGTAIRLKADAVVPFTYALITALLFYRTHYDPFYKDWSEDCWFARLGYVLAGVLLFVLKDALVKVIQRIRKGLTKPSNTTSESA